MGMVKRFYTDVALNTIKAVQLRYGIDEYDEEQTMYEIIDTFWRDDYEWYEDDDSFSLMFRYLEYNEDGFFHVVELLKELYEEACRECFILLDDMLKKGMNCEERLSNAEYVKCLGICNACRKVLDDPLAQVE